VKTFVVNLLGGSGLGKSTTAAKLFGELKTRGETTELVREFVKEWAWSGKKVGPFGQSIIYGQQLERESSLYGKVEFIVTDSPLLLCPVYQKHYNGHESIKHCVFKDLQLATDMNVVHVNFLLKRMKPFDARGRYEDEKTAKLIDRKVEAFLTYHGIEYIPVDCSDEDRVKFIADSVIEIRSKTVGDLNV
jgi:nicotinamide riboside kinase